LTTSPNFGTNLLSAERPTARRHHFGTPGDIISESAGDFVGICMLQARCAEALGFAADTGIDEAVQALYR
jgi:hypothetical protein